MNAEEAKLIVQCRRPCGRDDGDPVIREALEALDPAAVAVMQRESGLDALIAGRLRLVEPPADLKQKILAGARVARSRPVWRRPLGIAAAAAVLAAGIPAVWHFRPQPPAPVFAALSLADFRLATTQKLNEGPNLQRVGGIDRVREHLAGNSRMKSVPVPERLCQCPGGTVGCEVFQWKGHEVTLICFNSGRSGRVHLFTLDAAALGERPVRSVYSPVNGWHTLSWMDGGKLMLLAGRESETTAEDLEHLTVASR